MIKKILQIGVAIIICLSILSACGDYSVYNDYSASIVDSELVFREDFLKENTVYGTYYYNDNYNPDEDEWWEEYPMNETSPKFRIFIITEKHALDEIFTDFPETDFENEMVLIYCYANSHSKSHIIKNIRLEGKKLKIEFTQENGKSGYGDATLPQRRILVIKTEKLNITEAEFKKVVNKN